jgi:hypothetical protein
MILLPSLMIAFRMIVLHKTVDRDTASRSEEDHAVEALFLDRSHKSLGARSS